MSTDKPIHEIRLVSIKASIWKNQSPSGTYYNATFTRLYKDGEDWKSASTFGRDDLLSLAKLADRVHSWICERRGDAPQSENHSVKS